MKLLHNMKTTMSRYCIYLLFVCAVLSGCGDDEGTTRLAEEQQTSGSGQEGTEPASSSGTTPSVLSENIVAVVNGEEISVSELAERLHVATSRLDEATTIDEYTLNRLREGALQEVINRHLILQKAQEQNVTVSEEEFQHLVNGVLEEYHEIDIRKVLEKQGQSYEEWEQAQRETLLLEKLVDLNMASMISVSPEEIQQYYERNKENYDHPAQIRASQILTYEEDIARKALQEIQSGADFAQVAQKYSESADAQTGGDLGFFARGVMPPEFDEVLFSLEMGKVSQVIKTPYGYQIFKLSDQREAHRVSFEEAKSQIEERLKKQKRMFAIDLWIADLQTNAKIILNPNVVKQVN